MDLLIGAGSSRVKRLAWPGQEGWKDLITLDFCSRHNPDVIHDLNEIPLPFDDDACDSISAYDVLEHVGQQGDWRFFFDQWAEFWRILRPNGCFFGTSPHYSSPWAWGDPGHTRVITAESFTILHQPAYEQVGKTPMTDYRKWYDADFDILHTHVNEARQLEFVLRAVKPSRISI